jgi:hypothetical protein
MVVPKYLPAVMPEISARHISAEGVGSNRDFNLDGSCAEKEVSSPLNILYRDDNKKVQVL